MRALVFTGTYEHTIDAKQRLAIPAEIRAQLGAGGTKGVEFFVTLGEGKSLCLYPREQFEKRSAELDQSDRSPEEILAYETLYYSLARRVEMDKNGRVRLPESMLQMVGLRTEVVLLGVKDHLQVRDRQAWQAYVSQVLTSDPKFLVNPRRFMHRSGGPAMPNRG